MPAAPSSDFFAPLRASDAVKRLFHAAACQRRPSCDILRSLCASGPVK